MAQLARTLTPAASALHYFGAEVRRLRMQRGWSQAELGTAVIVSKDLVRRIEGAERFPTTEFVRRCDDILDAHGHLQRMRPMLEREHSLHANRDAAKGDNGYCAGLCDQPVLDWLISEPRPTPSGKPEEDLGQQLSRLRQLDHEHGGGRYYGVVSGSLPSVQLASPGTAIGYLELAGYEAVDLGADGAAQRHYLRALDLAVQVGNRLHGGYLIAVSLAHLALHCGDPSQAVRLATAALYGTRDSATPATRAAFHTVIGRAQARLGNEPEATAALLKADRDLARSRPQDEPAFIAYFTPADLADERAHAFFDLGHHRSAQREARTAIATVAPSRMRRLAIDNALLASSLSQAGDLEEACTVGMRAIDCTAATVSFRSVHRIMMMLAHMQPHLAVPAVRDLFAYANASLPAATPTLPLPQ